MPLYFYLLEQRTFHERIHPTLTASWNAKSFVPCRPICNLLLPAANTFQQKFHLAMEDLLIPQVAGGLAFDRHFWRLLVGEMLLVAAAEIPEMETAPDTLCCLLAPEQFRQHVIDRRRFAPIQQAHFGTRDLVFGSAIYRPENVGWNDENEVIRLADYLASLDPNQWRQEDLRAVKELAEEADREEELAYVRDWFPALVDLYQRGRRRRNIIVCEVL